MLFTGGNSDLKLSSNQELSSFLHINAPDKNLANAPPVFVFKRKREIEIPWVELWDGLKNKTASNNRALSRYFERSWGIDEDEGINGNELAELLAADPPYLLVQKPKPPEPVEPAAEGKPTAEAADPQPPPLVFYLSCQSDDQHNGADDKPIAVTTGVFCRHGLSSRWYLLLTQTGSEGPYPDFADIQQYNDYWRNDVVGVSVVYSTAEEASAMRTRVREIDLRAPYIERRYRELELQLEAAKSKATQYATLTAAGANSLEEIEANADCLYRLKLDAVSIDRQRELLVAQAADLGYKLFLEKPGADADYPPGFPQDQITNNKVVPGKLYKIRSETVTWTVQVSKPYFKVKKAIGIAAIGLVSGGLGLIALGVGLARGGFKGKKWVDSPRYGEAVFYDAVEPRQDLAELERRRLEADEKKSVYILEDSETGFATQDGYSLNGLMAHCDADENFRKSCVVFLPVYETSITGEVALTHYTVFENALPGIVPTMLPRLSFLESLSFKSTWDGAELGELAAGVNLAPGETREVTITKEVRRETTERRSSTSIFDLNRSDTQDFSFEMENQVKNETELNTNAEVSARASGKVLGFSTKASAKAGVNKSIKDFSNAIVKSAKKAAQTLNSNTHQEVSTSTEVKASVTQTDVTRAKLENINQGRTLNLFFYRLYNRYRTGLYIDDLSFDVISGIEVIAGSGIYQSKRYPLDNLAGMLECLNFHNLPFGLGKEDAYLYCHRVIDVFYELLIQDYVDKRDGKVPRTKSAKSSDTDNRYDFSSPLMLKTDKSVESYVPKLQLNGAIDPSTSPKQKNNPQGVSNRIKGLSRWLGKKGLKSAPMIESSLSVLSDALYLDAAVGASPSTEPYSELMRTQEVKLKEAEIYSRYSDGVYKQAQAARLTGMAPDGGLNAIIGYLPDPVSNSLTVSLRRPLGPGNWMLQLNGSPVAAIDERWALHQVISVPFGQGDRVLNDEGALKTLELINAETEQLVSLSV